MPSFPVSYYSDEPIHSPLKVNLFTRIHEMRSSLSQLTPIAQKPLLEKKKWLSENEEFLQRLLETVSQDDPIQFEEPEMDGDMMKLLMEYTAVLQDLVAVIQSIFQAQNPRASTRRTLRSKTKKSSRGK